jgi:hypothetical protein
MKLSKITLIIIIFIFYLIFYYSIRLITFYYNPKGIMYLDIYSSYYYFFFIILLVAIGCNSFINPLTIPSTTKKE